MQDSSRSVSHDRYVGEQPTVQNLTSIDGWPISIPTLGVAVAAIAAYAEAGRSFTAFTLNLDHLVKLRRDARFRDAYRTASMVTADGAPIVWLSRLQGADVSRATGADLVVPLMAEAASRRLPVYLFGTTGQVLAKAGQQLAARSGGTLDIVGTDAPGHGFDPTSPEADAAIKRIADSGARIALIALGAPKQEIFAARAQSQGVKCGFVCVGAALDFLVGAQVRAPRFMQTTGTEWLWRLATNPWRLTARYIQCAMVLVDLAVVQPLRHRLAGVGHP